MAGNGEIRASFSSDVSTFFHHTEVGEAIRQTTFARETYLGVAKVYGLKNKEYLVENLQGVKVGDRVTLYRKYNKESPECTGLTPYAIPDDGASIRIYTLSGMCLGYIQPPERFIYAALMKAGKHLYAKVHSLNVPESLDKLNTREAITLDVYWVEETTPLKMENTFEVGEPKYEPMEQNGDAIWLLHATPDSNFRFINEIVDRLKRMNAGDRLSLIWKPSTDDPWCVQVWNAERTEILGFLEYFQVGSAIPHLMDAGKHVYGVVTSRQYGDYPHLLNYEFDLYLEDN